MKKVAIITLPGYFNYGNILQNYALQYFVNNLFKEQVVTTIWFTKTDLKTYKKFTLKTREIFRHNGFGGFINRLIHFQKAVRDYNFKNFHNKYIKLTYEKNKSDLNEKYDYFIVGSDQVWNPWWIKENTYFLQFADKQKRISYAASFGVSEINPDKIEDVKKGIQGMNFVSVREHAGAKIVKELTGIDVPVLVDPTLLLTKAEWDEVTERPEWYKDEKFILLYFLGDLPDKVKKEVQNLSNKYKLKIIDLMDNENIDFYSAAPGEFLYLIQNCSLMCTDSFHGTVFSILNKKPFITCSRGSGDTDSRIDTLLQRFNLEDRKISKANNYEITDPMEIEYPDVEAILNTERQRSKEFLCKALNIKE